MYIYNVHAQLSIPYCPFDLRGVLLVLFFAMDFDARVIFILYYNKIQFPMDIISFYNG